MEKVSKKFGEIYIQEVRDRAINKFEKIFDGRMKGMTAKQVQAKISDFDSEQKQILLWLVSKIVDECLFDTLSMLEEHEDEISLMCNGKNVCQESDGLPGELLGENGWIAQFSQKYYEE